MPSLANFHAAQVELSRLGLMTLLTPRDKASNWHICPNGVSQTAQDCVPHGLFSKKGKVPVDIIWFQAYDGRVNYFGNGLSGNQEDWSPVLAWRLSASAHLPHYPAPENLDVWEGRQVLVNPYASPPPIPVDLSPPDESLHDWLAPKRKKEPEICLPTFQAEGWVDTINTDTLNEIIKNTCGESRS